MVVWDDRMVSKLLLLLMVHHLGAHLLHANLVAAVAGLNL